jgi:hypothetical protein
MCRRDFAFLAAASTLASALAFGQTSKGTIAGVITDPTTATIAGATVAAKDT